MSGSSVSFFSKGMIIAILKLAGTSASERERLMISVMEGKRMSTHSLTSLVGIGSRAQSAQSPE